MSGKIGVDDREIQIFLVSPRAVADTMCDISKLDMYLSEMGASSSHRSVCAAAYLYVCPCVRLSVDPSVCLSCLSIRQSVCDHLPVRLSVCQSLREYPSFRVVSCPSFCPSRTSESLWPASCLCGQLCGRVVYACLCRSECGALSAALKARPRVSHPDTMNHACCKHCRAKDNKLSTAIEAKSSSLTEAVEKGRMNREAKQAQEASIESLYEKV